MTDNNDNLQPNISVAQVAEITNNNQEASSAPDLRSLPPEERKIKEREIFDNLPDDDARIAWNEGWRPQELFNNKNKDGSERQFIDYKEFLENSQRIAPIRNERLRELADKNQILEQQIQKMSEDMRTLLEINKTREIRDLENTQTYLNREIERAKEEMDFERYAQLLEQKQKYSNTYKEVPTNPTPSVPSAPQLSPQDQMTINGWKQNNSWFDQDIEMRNMAAAYDNSLLMNPQTAHLPLNQRLEMVSAKIKTIYPNKFQKRSTIQMVEGNDLGGMGNANTRHKTYNDLPKGAKETCDWAVERGISTREAYVKSYFKNQN
jgi:hypothetical protein